jgi:serine/threonine protein kinase
MFGISLDEARYTKRIHTFLLIHAIRRSTPARETHATYCLRYKISYLVLQLIEIGQGLSYLHVQGIVHGDIKDVSDLHHEHVQGLTKISMNRPTSSSATTFMLKLLIWV